MKRVTVVIPNYNGMRYLPQCIAALRHQTVQDFELLVVENASQDGSADWLRAEGVPFLQETENLGFAGGVNAGIRKVRTPYVILLNNDTEVFPSFVEMLLREIERHPRIFSVSALMLRTQNHSAVDDAGDALSLPGWAWQRGTGEPAARYRESCEVFSACGGAAIYRTELLKQLGLFDEAHFAYLEDTDLGWRAKLCGYHNRYCPEARVLHYGSATSGSKYNAFKVRLASRNHIWLLYKNMPDWQLILNFPWILVGMLVKAVFFAKKGLLSAWLSGTAEGFRGLGRVSRVDFSRISPAAVLSVQWEMLIGTFLYLQHLIRRGRRAGATEGTES